MGLIDLALWARQQYVEHAMDAAGRMHDALPIDPRAHRDVQEMQHATLPHAAGTLVVLDARWSSVQLDWLNRGPFEDRLIQPIGFSRICPGRHELRCCVPGTSDLTPPLSVVVYPREVVVRRLVSGRWIPVTRSVQAQLEAAIANEDCPLEPYFAWRVMRAHATNGRTSRISPSRLSPTSRSSA